MKQKLAIFIYSLGSGGAERVVSTLLPHLAKHFKLYLILMSDKIVYEIKGVKVHFLEKSRPNENAILKFLKLPFLALKYKKMCKNLGISAHFIFLNRPIYIAIIARIFGLKGRFIINECTTPSVIYQGFSLNSLVNKFLIFLLYKRADLILANSRGNLVDLICNFKQNPQKCALLFNALDLEKIASKAREELDFKDKFILSVGRLDKGKNHALLIKAYARLKTNIKLIILGEGPLKNDLKKLIKKLNLQDKILLFGFEKNPFKFMARCEFFAFASLFEGFSNVLIEALACGAAVVSSDHKSGARELLGDDEFGLLVKVNDENAMYFGLKKILENENLRLNYKEKSIARAKEFDVKKIANLAVKFIKNEFKND